MEHFLEGSALLKLCVLPNSDISILNFSGCECIDEKCKPVPGSTIESCDFPTDPCLSAACANYSSGLSFS